MARIKKVCRVCGKEYSACSSSLGDTVFRWRNVACSPSCGAEYVRRIQLSRVKAEDVLTVAEPLNNAGIKHNDTAIEACTVIEVENEVFEEDEEIEDFE